MPPGVSDFLDQARNTSKEMAGMAMMGFMMADNGASLQKPALGSGMRSQGNEIGYDGKSPTAVGLFLGGQTPVSSSEVRQLI